MDNFGAVGGAIGSVGSAAGSGVSGGAMGVASGGFDVADSSFESVSSSVPEVGAVIDSPIEGEIVSGVEESGRIMEIPGTPHDKLEGLANIEESEPEMRPVEEEVVSEESESGEAEGEFAGTDSEEDPEDDGYEDEGKNYYQILGVSEDADSKVIKKAFRKMVLKYHPDVNLDQDAEAKFERVISAYETLSDHEKRQDYDENLKKEREEAAESESNSEDDHSSEDAQYQGKNGRKTEDPKIESSAPAFEASGKAELTVEQQIMLLQAEALKLLAKSMSEKVDKKEKEDLVKKLKKLLKKIDEEENPRKASLLAGIFNIILIFIEFGDKGVKIVDDEVKLASA